MESMLFVGTTDADGNLTIMQRIYHPRRLVKVRWLAGDFADGVDATLINLGVAGAESTLGLASGALNSTLLTLTDANDDAWYDAVSNTIVDMDLRLTVTNGGANKRGGCIAYFDEAIDGVSLGTITEPTVTSDSWRVSTLNFTTADDSDNTFTVPANTEYQILSVYVSLVTTATVGNRQMAVQALDASNNVLLGARAGVVQAASLTRAYSFAPGLPQDTAFRDTDYLGVSLPAIFLAPGQKLRVYDKAAIAAAADDMTVRVQIASRSVA